LSGNHSKIVLLGTGTPNADPNRSGPSLAIVVNYQAYLVDFGPGVVRRAAAASQAGIDALEPRNLKLAFLTHLHSDHTAGYPDLILTPWVLERDQPLRVFGPPGLRHLTENILSAYQADIQERINGLEPANERGYIVESNEILQPGMIYQDSFVQVEALPARHGSWNAYGYKFHTPDRVIVISGDTAPNIECLSAYQGCDVMIHEVYSYKGLMARPPEWQRYHRNYHTSTRELAKIASQIKPELLILYHQLFWGTSEQELLEEIREGYAGEIVSGKDLGLY
jgi:ribonuclease BN (tRNA processing enzyme)